MRIEISNCLPVVTSLTSSVSAENNEITNLLMNSTNNHMFLKHYKAMDFHLVLLQNIKQFLFTFTKMLTN